MKVLGIIPARYCSTRLPGKPLADICGRPMIWWVYQKVKQASVLDDLVVAVDDEKVFSVCKQYGMHTLMTDPAHPSHINRLHEVSENIAAELYVCACGDEPLIDPAVIERVVPAPNEIEPFIVQSLMRELNDPAEAADPSNLKLVTDLNGYGMVITRGLVPFPYRAANFKYKKVVGIECYNKKALDFYHTAQAGPLEMIEDITLLRFIEYGKPIKFILTDAYQLSVDTPHDLEKVRRVIREKLERGELEL